MKEELSIKEKASRYDKALTKARSIVNSINVGLIGKDSFEAVFPELKESDDAKIIDEIADFIYDKTDTEWLREKSNKWLAWLEKQKQKVWTDNDYDTVKSIEYLLHELDNHNFDDWFNSLIKRKTLNNV